MQRATRLKQRNETFVHEAEFYRLKARLEIFEDGMISLLSEG